MKQFTTLMTVLMLAGATAVAKVDLVTLPTRDQVQLTIYNSADMTLVRESRALTLREGDNRLQFSWANTLIDPTSLDMLAKGDAAAVTIADLVYPPRVRNLGVWTLASKKSGKVPVEISYLTSGLSWRAFYSGTLSRDEQTMRLDGFVRIQNNSGEDYENAQTRLIVGQVHMIDEIVALAQREHPFGRPFGGEGEESMPMPPAAPMRRQMKMAMAEASAFGAADMMAPKEIKKEGLSEYFLYTIAGTETIPHGWSKRLPSLTAEGVPVVNLYKFEEERYGKAVIHVLSFKNDKAHKLGETPLPGGNLKVFRTVDADAHLGYVGESAFQYIPVDEDVELSLGPTGTVLVEPTLMDTKTENFMFDRDGNIDGWDEWQRFKVEVNNTRTLPVRIEIQRQVGGANTEVKPGPDSGTFEQVDLDTVKFTLTLAPQSEKTFHYEVRTRHGRRAN